MNEKTRVRREQLQVKIDKIERLKNLKENGDFKLFMDEVLRLRDAYYGELSNFSSGKGLTMEVNYLRIIEAQLRYESFNAILTLIDSGVNQAKQFKNELEKIDAQEVE